jgi:hypothetical protein
LHRSLCYQRVCDQLFTGNASTSSKKYHETHESPATESSPIFPPECIFCDRIEVKIAGKTERPTKFTPESAWNKIEEWADEMKDYDLCHKVFMLTSLLMPSG